MNIEDGVNGGARLTSHPPFTLEGIEHVLLLVQGIEESLAFYVGVLGAQVEAHLPQYALTELRVGISHLDLVDTIAPEGLWAFPPIAGGRNVDHVALRIGPHDELALRQHLGAHAVPIIEERVNEDARAPSLSLYVHDPSGNVIELMA